MSFLLRILWLLRGNRRVVLHLADRPGTSTPSIEGVLTGCYRGHYVVLAPVVFEAADRSTKLAGHLEVPRENVLMIEVKS
jgi:hypothetical protein